jgi:hypothetical protein
MHGLKYPQEWLQNTHQNGCITHQGCAGRLSVALEPLEPSTPVLLQQATLPGAHVGLTWLGGMRPYPGAYTGRGCAMPLGSTGALGPPGKVLNKANPLKVPFIMSVTMLTAKLKL